MRLDRHAQRTAICAASRHHTVQLRHTLDMRRDTFVPRLPPVAVASASSSLPYPLYGSASGIASAAALGPAGDPAQERRGFVFGEPRLARGRHRARRHLVGDARPLGEERREAREVVRLGGLAVARVAAEAAAPEDRTDLGRKGGRGACARRGDLARAGRMGAGPWSRRGGRPHRRQGRDRHRRGRRGAGEETRDRQPDERTTGRRQGGGRREGSGLHRYGISVMRGVSPIAIERHPRP